MTALHYQSLSQILQQIVTGQLSSAEITEHMVNRIVDCDAELHSYALLMMESAAQQAAAMDAERAAGAPLRPLHGVPIAVKDLLYTRGVQTASGTRVMRDFKPTYDATVITRLREAGAVILGKTQLTEGAFGAHHPDIEAPKNPYNRDHWPGVSSSGSGVAVAAGLAFGALGTDTGGSIRFPSAACGLVGLKPTYGRVSRYGAFALADSLDHIGPMCRSVEDAARLLAVIAGPDANDPTALSVAVPDYVAAVGAPLGTLRIGVDWGYAATGVDADVVAALQGVCDRFTAAGAQLVEVQVPPDYAELVASWSITCGVECARAHADFYPAQRAEYGPVLASLLDLGRSVEPARYQAVEQIRQRFRSALDSLFTQVDVLLAPCMTSVAPTVAAMDAAVTSEDSRAPFINFTAPFDYSGHPTLTLPAGLNAAGLPLSFQLIGPQLGEALLLRAGAAHERALGPMPHPPVA